MSTTSFLLFFIFSYFFSLINTVAFSGLPFFIMLYSVIISFLANFLGGYFETPFKVLANNIEIFTLNKDKDKIKNNFSISEFDFLQKFILAAFEVNEEKEKAKKELGIIAKQVAHDIRSPAAAILMLVKEYTELQEEQRISLRDAAHRIQDIANNLLHQSKTEKTNKISNIETCFLVLPAIISVVSEKKVQYKDSNIRIECDSKQEAAFSFINANLSEFKRVISNLLDNAIEAIQNSGNIFVQLSSDTNLIRINIVDNGKGMPAEIQEKILNGQVATSKINGLGLGFSHTRSFLVTSEGQLEISTSENHGTTISLLFKKASNPSWVADEIKFHRDSIIVILDDHSAIHGAWDSIFSTLLANNSTLKIVHFTQAIGCINYIKGLEKKYFDKVLLLADYELIKQDFNGLDVIELTQLKKSVLVTSYYESNDILKRAALLNTKLLPKMLAPNITLHIMDIKPIIKKSVDLVLLEDNKELSDIISYLCKFRGKSVDLYHETYTFFENLDCYNKLSTRICLDFDLGSLVNGIELASALHKRGFEKLYLASGYKFNINEVPSYLQILSDKMELLNLC